MCVFAVSAVLCLSACGSSSSGQPGKSGDTGEEYYSVSIVGSEVVDDGHGSDAIVVTFDYANKTGTPVNFMQAVPTVAAQGGTPMAQDPYITDYVGADGVTPDYMVKVEPGASSTVHMAFTMTSGDAVTVRCALGFVDGGYPDPNKVLAEATIQP